MAVFLDIAGAFDNVIPSILFDDFRKISFPAFTENLLCERQIFSIRNGNLLEPLTFHKGIPQGSILSPIFFNIYLHKIAYFLHPDTEIL